MAAAPELLLLEQHGMRPRPYYGIMARAAFLRRHAGLLNIPVGGTRCCWAWSLTDVGSGGDRRPQLGARGGARGAVPRAPAASRAAAGALRACGRAAVVPDGRAPAPRERHEL